MNYRRMLAIGMALCSAQSAAAADWQFIVASPDGQGSFYAEPKSLVLQGPIRRVRLLQDYKKVQKNPGTAAGFQSETVLASLDCEDRKFGSIQAVKYAGNMTQGAIVAKSPPLPRVNYRDVTPDSINDKLLQYVCALKNPKAKRR